jgi:S1-C subfamily serine protease
MARQKEFEAYFRTPEEPPVRGLEFTEPPPAAEDAGPPRPAANNAGQLAPEVLRKIKASTVYLRVRSGRGESEGSGFFAIEPGFVITNAHVVGMLMRNAPEPQSIQVVRNKGEKDEAKLTAKVVAVDADADLALLSVPRDGLPPPLVIRSAESLQETQPVYVAGFPLGEVPGKSVTINKYVLSSLKKEKGVLDKLQVQGDMQPGNSGGPVLDADGDVVGVCVSILRGTTINFAIPGDKVRRFLDGRLDDITLEAPVAGPGGLRVPVSVRVVDPLGRLRQAGVDYWVGKAGSARPGCRTPPQAQPGDSPRQTLALDLNKRAGRGELALPPLPPGQTYWLQPSLVSSTGTRVWLSAQVYQPPPPVERKPARLVLKPAAERRLVLDRWSALRFSVQGHEYGARVALEARLTDTTQGAEGDDPVVYRQLAGVKEGVAIGDDLFMTTRLQHVAPYVQFACTKLVLDAQGSTRRDEMDLNKLKDAPSQSKRYLSSFQWDTQQFLKALEVPLPPQEVPPGETWSAARPLPTDTTWTQLDFLPASLWGPIGREFLQMNYTYVGTRRVNGSEVAVIQIRGQRWPPGDGSAAARVTGTATVDLATGQVVEEEVTTQLSADLQANLQAMNVPIAKIQGTVVARLRRE